MAALEVLLAHPGTLAVFAAANLAAASTGAIFKPGPWYAGLDKPRWTPPNFAFPIAWMIMFSLSAAAGALVWLSAGWGAAMALYAVHLFVNAAWSALFFGARRMDWALIDVGVLWVMLAGLIALFWPIAPLAAMMMAPYLAWVTLAAVLNLEMVRRNPEWSSAAAGRAPGR